MEAILLLISWSKFMVDNGNPYAVSAINADEDFLDSIDQCKEIAKSISFDSFSNMMMEFQKMKDEFVPRSDGFDFGFNRN